MDQDSIELANDSLKVTLASDKPIVT